MCRKYKCAAVLCGAGNMHFSAMGQYAASIPGIDSKRIGRLANAILKKEQPKLLLKPYVMLLSLA